MPVCLFFFLQHSSAHFFFHLWLTYLAVLWMGKCQRANLSFLSCIRIRRFFFVVVVVVVCSTTITTTTTTTQTSSGP
ncbi:hypothetical protein PSV09DRAFT_2349035 [Bipolaris maydis]|uniref:uncharacterized protein n=1 Tax=Cochliobolus heterostrophus TaxID=5016 RepID=UPI0024DCF2DD|nr:hypothetical protein J3E74DRAFT_379994 [Bipolaris maydis]KAJ6204142.1 hypothetical protein PSV09DRAFT_2349035 [Bipolaris maydis]KAJ6265934.1 hypothetical protein PSV08DRAFT_340373 [Bipolaris maydis]